MSMMMTMKCVEPRTSALNMTLPACGAGVPAIDRYIPPAFSSKLVGRRCCCRLTEQTDGRTDTRPSHRPRTACSTGSVNIRNFLPFNATTVERVISVARRYDFDFYYTWGDGDVTLFHICASRVLPPSCR